MMDVVGNCICTPPRGVDRSETECFSTASIISLPKSDDRKIGCTYHLAHAFFTQHSYAAADFLLFPCFINTHASLMLSSTASIITPSQSVICIHAHTLAIYCCSFGRYSLMTRVLPGCCFAGSDLM